MSTETETKKWPAARIVTILMVVIALGLLIALALPCFFKARNTSCSNACVNNLRMIDSGKEQAALAEHWEDGRMPDVRIVNEYIKGNTTPICPGPCAECREKGVKAGTYSYNLIGSNPTCSTECPHSGHRMPVGR